MTLVGRGLTRNKAPAKPSVRKLNSYKGYSRKCHCGTTKLVCTTLKPVKANQIECVPVSTVSITVPLLLPAADYLVGNLIRHARAPLL